MNAKRHAAEPFIGAEIAGFRVRRLLGAGGMGAVFEGIAVSREAPRQRVAIKILDAKLVADSKLRERFLREAEAQQALDHPHIVPIFAAGEARGVAYIAMELMDGGSLADRLHEAGKLTEAEARPIFRQMLSGLWHAHANGYVHRDIKPDNVLFRATGEVALADFGIVGILGESEATNLTQTGTVIGTPAYMSPEACKAEPVDQRSDLYSMGAVMYHVLAGRPPFESPAMLPLLMMQISQPAVPLSHALEISDDLDAIVLRLLEKKPADRIPTAEEVLRVLTDGYLHDALHGARHRKLYQAVLQAAQSPTATIAETVAAAPRISATRVASRPTARRAGGAMASAKGASKALAEPLIASQSARPMIPILAGVCGALAIGWVITVGVWQAALGEKEGADTAAADLRTRLAARETENERLRQQVLDLRAEVTTGLAQLAAARMDVAHAHANEMIRRLEYALPREAVLIPTVQAWPADTLGNYRRSLDDLIGANAVNPQRVPLQGVHWACRGLLRTLDEPRDDSAIEADFELACDLARDAEIVWLLRAHSQLHRRLQSEAAASAAEACRCAPTSGIARVMQARALRLGRDFARAVRMLDEAVKIDPSCVPAFVQKAQVIVDWYHLQLETIGRPTVDLAVAIEACSRAIAVDSQNAHAFMFRGVIHQLVRAFELAIRDYDEALRLDPRNPGAYFHRANTHRYMGNAQKAFDDYTAAIRLLPTAPHQYASRGAAAMELENWQVAADDFAESLRLQPGQWVVWSNLAVAHSRLGRRSEALAAIDEALACCPDASRAQVQTLKNQILQR